MDDNNSNDKVSKEVKYPKIFVDEDNDFASIRIKSGIEFRSFMKDGILFSEDENGNIIEIQILSLKDLVKINDKLAS